MNGPADKEALRVGIVGCGSIARAHALSYQNNAHVELVGVVDVDPARAAAFAAGYGTAVYGSCRELLDHQPDLVSVATPPGNHTEVAVELLESGCSVLLEKPPTTTLADMDVLADAEKLSSGSVYVVFQHRHGSGARRAHHLLQSGALGTPRLAVCETLWYRPDSYFLPESIAPELVPPPQVTPPNASGFSTEFTPVGTDVLFGRSSPADGAAKVLAIIQSMK